MPEVNANQPADAPQSAEVDISIFTPAHLRPAPTEEPKNDGQPQPEDETADADDVQQPADDGAGDADDGSDGGDGPDADGRRKRSTSDRIKKLTADKRYWEREALALRAKLAEATPAPAAENPGLTPEKADAKSEAVQEPDPAKYKYGELDPRYISDLADYRAELKLQAYERKQMEAQQAEAADRALDQVRAKAAEVTTAGAAKFPDFEEVVVEAAKAGEFALTQEMFETAAATPVAADLLYHLAKNPVEALAVSQMNPREQGLWFGRMEAKFTASAPKPEPKRVSSAPEPLSPVRGSGGQFATPAATTDFAAFEKMAAAKG